MANNALRENTPDPGQVTIACVVSAQRPGGEPEIQKNRHFC
jgi:hypothetical protein